MVLLAHPDAARLISERPVTSPNAFRLFDAGLGIFRSAGFRDEEAVAAYFAFGNYVMGCAAQEHGCDAPVAKTDWGRRSDVRFRPDIVRLLPA